MDVWGWCALSFRLPAQPQLQIFARFGAEPRGGFKSGWRSNQSDLAAAGSQLCQLRHELHFSIWHALLTMHTHTPPITLLLVILCTRPSTVNVLPQGAAQRPFISRYAGETIDSLHTCACLGRDARGEERRRDREGRSFALAEEDGREWVVLADRRHVIGGLVGGVGKLVILIIRAPRRNSLFRHLIVSPEVGGAVHIAGAVGKPAIGA